MHLKIIEKVDHLMIAILTATLFAYTFIYEIGDINSELIRIFILSSMIFLTLSLFLYSWNLIRYPQREKRYTELQKNALNTYSENITNFINTTIIPIAAADIQRKLNANEIANVSSLQTNITTTLDRVTEPALHGFEKKYIDEVEEAYLNAFERPLENTEKNFTLFIDKTAMKFRHWTLLISYFLYFISLLLELFSKKIQ